MITRDLNGFYLKTEKNPNQEQTTIFDGIGIGLGKNKDNLTYNHRIKGVKDIQRLENIICNTKGNIAECIIWVDFSNPQKRLKTIQNKKELELYGKIIGAYSYNLEENDNVIIFDTPKLIKELNIKSLALAGAVADCAGICGNYKTGEIISITHAGWEGILNGVIEQLIHAYIAELGKKEFKKVKFNISPMAGVNYEWESKYFNIIYLKEYKSILEEIINEIKSLNGDDLVKYFLPGYDEAYPSSLVNKGEDKREKYLKKIEKNKKIIEKFINIYEEYEIDPIADKIFEKTTESKGFFYLDRLIKRIFLENGASLDQLNFHKDYTTDLNNSWPSYRIHSLWQKGLIKASWTKKENNGIIYDKRIGIFNKIKIK